MKINIYVIFLILFIGINISYAQVTNNPGDEFLFVWTPNTEPDLAGYRCYISMTSGEYTYGEENAYSLYGLVSESPPHSISTPGTYFFVLTAYDTEGFESNPSNELYLIVEQSTITSPINLRFVGITDDLESVVYKDTIYAEFKNQENIEYDPKETYNE